MTRSLLPPSPEVERRLAGTPLLVMLDVDGTLAPIAPRPELAAVPERTKELVRALATRRGVHVAVVSGRAALDARAMVAPAEVWSVGNHGMERIAPNGIEHVDERVMPYMEVVADAAARLREALAGVDGALVEDKRLTLSVHYRLAHDEALPRVREATRAESERSGLLLMEGKRVLELRPPVRVDKGTAAVALARAIGAHGEGAAICYVGDDRTDEDAFGAVRAEGSEAVTVHVGRPALADGSATAAEFCVADTDAVATFLEWLLARR